MPQITPPGSRLAAVSDGLSAASRYLFTREYNPSLRHEPALRAWGKGLYQDSAFIGLSLPLVAEILSRAGNNLHTSTDWIMALSSPDPATRWTASAGLLAGLTWGFNLPKAGSRFVGDAMRNHTIRRSTRLSRTALGRLRIAKSGSNDLARDQAAVLETVLLRTRNVGEAIRQLHKNIAQEDQNELRLFAAGLHTEARVAKGSEAPSSDTSSSAEPPDLRLSARLARRADEILEALPSGAVPVTGLSAAPGRAQRLWQYLTSTSISDAMWKGGQRWRATTVSLLAEKSLFRTGAYLGPILLASVPLGRAALGIEPGDPVTPTQWALIGAFLIAPVVNSLHFLQERGGQIWGSVGGRVLPSSF